MSLRDLIFSFSQSQTQSQAEDNTDLEVAQFNEINHNDEYTENEYHSDSDSNHSLDDRDLKG